jgi:hypothetical protein
VTWGDEDEPAGPVHPDVYAWLRDWLAPHYLRSLDTGGLAWCPQWHRHPEAVSRLTGLWMSWEALAAKDTGTGLATWWLNFCDPTMQILLDGDQGPFKRCTRGHAERQPEAFR